MRRIWTPRRSLVMLNTAAVAPAFSPSDVSGLVFWTEAEDLSSTPVSLWPNKASTGSGYDAVQATGANQPTLVSSAYYGQNTVRYASSDHFDFAGNGLKMARNVSGLTTFHVIKLDSTIASGDQDFFTIMGNNFGLYRYRIRLDASNGISVAVRRDDADSNAFTPSAAKGIVSTYYQLITVVHDYSTATCKVYWNDSETPIINVSVGTSGSTSDTDSLYVTLGGIQNAGEFIGDNSANLVYQAALSDANRQAVRDYLMNKYGLSAWTPEDSSHTLAWFDAGSGITLNGSNVSQWTDRKNGYAATQGTAALQPGYAGGYVTFASASTQDLDLTTPMAAVTKNQGKLGLYVVAQMASSHTGFIFFNSTGTGATSNRMSIYASAQKFTEGIRRLDADISQLSGQTSVVTLNQDYLVSSRVDHVAITNELHRNNTLDYSASAYFSWLSGNTSNTDSLRTRIGSSGGGNYFNGKIKAIVLTDAYENRKQFEWFLNKYYEVY